MIIIILNRKLFSFIIVILKVTLEYFLLIYDAKVDLDNIRKLNYIFV